MGWIWKKWIFLFCFLREIILFFPAIQRHIAVKLHTIKTIIYHKTKTQIQKSSKFLKVYNFLNLKALPMGNKQTSQHQGLRTQHLLGIFKPCRCIFAGVFAAKAISPEVKQFGNTINRCSKSML